MRLLFVEPPISPFDVPTGIVALPEPLALETVAAGLCAHHDVRILDMRLETDGLASCLQEFQPQVVAVGAVTANLHLALEVLQQAKASDERILTVIGGHHVTFRPSDVHVPYVDAVVLGEGDRSMVALVEAFDRGQALTDVPGLALQQGERQLQTATAPLLDMDTLPVPARHLVARYRDRYFQRGYRPIVSINSSRGCPWKCDFCSLWVLNRGRYRVRAAELVVDEMAGLAEDFVDFIDDNSIEHRRRAHQIADLLAQRHIKKRLKMYARADTVERDPELIAKLADVGLEQLLVGFETYREDRLKSWNKGGTATSNHKAISILKQNGIRIISYFVIDPDFDRADFEGLWRYVQEMNLLNPIFTILVPFPGTKFYEMAQKQGRIIYDDFRLFDFFHTVFPTKLPLPEFYSCFAALYRKAYDPVRQLAAAPAAVSQQLVQAQADEFNVVFRRIETLASHHEQVLGRV